MGADVSDVIDTANAHYDIWLQAHIKQQTHSHAISIQSDCSDCIECGDDIGAVRRRALPHATRCIDCQTRLENRRKTY